jgi:uncharacterized lipoprotein NlpE involved in copper resistance
MNLLREYLDICTVQEKKQGKICWQWQLYGSGSYMAVAAIWQWQLYGSGKNRRRNFFELHKHSRSAITFLCSGSYMAVAAIWQWQLYGSNGTTKKMI